jgi:hypothetical protein
VIKSPFVALREEKKILGNDIPKRRIVIKQRKLNLFVVFDEKNWLWKTLGLVNALKRAKHYAKEQNVKTISLKYLNGVVEKIKV